MAKVFLDANFFIGLVNRAPEMDHGILDQHQGFVSILSCHILFYVNKVKVPDIATNSFVADFNLVELTQNILDKALTGPTDDLEDNIQLHSAIDGDCDVFLTADEGLLKLKFFGKMEIKPTLDLY